MCRWVLASRWIIPNKQQKQPNTSYLFSLLYDFQCGIQGFDIHTHIILLPILFTFHTLQNQMNNHKSHSHCFLSKQFHSTLHPLEILFIPFLSNNHTQYSKNTMEPLLDIFLFHSLQCLVQFSSVTSWRGFCLTISLMGSLGCVFYASPQFNHEYSASLRSCGQIDFPFASRHFSRPLQIGRVHIEFV